MSDAPIDRPRPGRPSAVLTLVGVLVALATVFAAPGTASAHTDFESSDPADGAVVEGPLTELSIDVTNPAVLSGDGIVVLAPDGTFVTPAAVDETDGTRFVLRFDPPLGPGTYGVRWEFQAGDAHPIEGSFRFDIAVPTPPSTTAAPAAPASTSATTTTTAATATTAPEADVAAAPITTEPPAAPTAPAAATGADTTTLEEFLADTGSSGEGEAAGRGGRMITFLATIAGLGALASLVYVLRGRRDELRTVLGWARLAGVGIAVGGLVEFSAVHAAAGATIADVATSQAGVAALLKVVGGTLVWVGLPRNAGRITAPSPSLSAATVIDPGESVTSPADERCYWQPTVAAGVGLVGYAVVLVSFWFDGHTVSRGPWPVHAAANLAHLLAAAIWGGGVLTLAAVAWMRHRRAEPAGVAAMIVRFSGIATFSLVAVTAAGIAMTWMIIDGPGDLTDTTWGRVLLVKLGAVAAIAAIGGYHHFRLVPMLEATPDDAAAQRELRRSLTVEALLFVVVLAVTAVLVASAT